MPRSSITVVVLVLITASALAPAAAATEPTRHAALPTAPPAQPEAGPAMPVTVAVDRTPSRPGHVRVTYRIEVPENVEEVELRLLERYANERIAVLTDDFTRTQRGDSPRYTAFSAGGTTRSLTVEYALPAEADRLTDLSPGYDTANWTYL